MGEEKGVVLGVRRLVCSQMLWMALSPVPRHVGSQTFRSGMNLCGQQREQKPEGLSG